jgi:hypothetical protein
MKVLKTKYDTELETRKQVESELATLRERMEQQQQPQEEKTKKTKKKKGKESDAEEETKIFKRYVQKHRIVHCMSPHALLIALTRLSTPSHVHVVRRRSWKRRRPSGPRRELRWSCGFRSPKR